MARRQLLTCALISMLASCAATVPAIVPAHEPVAAPETAPTTLPGPVADIPVFASDDPRVGTAGFVGQTLRLTQQHEGITYTLMSFVVGDTLTLGAMVKGTFAGDVRWSMGQRQLKFPFHTAAAQTGTFASVSDNPTAKIEGQGATFRGTAWMNFDLPLASWISNGAPLQLTFVSHDGANVTLPDTGHHYVVQLTPRR